MKHDRKYVVEIVNELLKYCAEHSGGKHEQQDDYAYFLHFFMNKMINHGKSLLMLYKSDNSDILLIVRSIIEGYALLKHATTDKQKISSKWRRHIYIGAYQEIQLIREKQQSLNMDENKERVEFIQTKCSDFVFNKGRYIKIGDNKYALNWYHPKSITKLIENLPNSVFRKAYSDYSAWHHWSPVSRLSSLETNNNIIDYKRHSSFDSSLVVGLSALMTSFSIYFKYMDDKISIEYLSETEKKISGYLPY